MSRDYSPPEAPRQQSNYNSLQEAVREALVLLLHCKNNLPYLTKQYELEVRLGSIKSYGGDVKTARSTLSGAEYIHNAGMTHSFDTNVSEETFYRCGQTLMQSLRPLCYSISPIETTFVVVQGTASRRWILDANNNCTSHAKNWLYTPTDFIGTTQTKMAHPPLALRISTCIEHDCGNDTSDFPEQFDTAPRRKRERRSIYFYDTTGFALPNQNAWADAQSLITKHPEGFAHQQINPWRVDMTRVNDGESFQIELEFDFALAWLVYSNDDSAKQMSTESVERYFKFRALAALGECIYRVQYAIDVNTPLSWLRKL